MALSCFVDAFNIGTGAVASTVVRTGYGFTPKACVYWWSGRTESTDTAGRLDVKAGVGVATSATDRRCITVQSDDTPTTMATDRKHNNAQMIECLTIAGAVDGNADLQSFDTDGQTLVIDDQFTTNLRVHCLALGGSDLTNVATFQLQAPTVTGNADFTGLSFQPDAILLFSAGITSAPPSIATHHILSLGVAAGSGQGVAAFVDRDSVGTSVTSYYSRSDECVALFDGATNTLVFHASFVSMLSNGFRLNWTEVTTGQPYVFGLALKGGQSLVGNLTMVTTLNATAVESGFGFEPTGALFFSHNDVASLSDTPASGVYASVGAMTSVSQRGAQTWTSGHNATTAVCGAGLDHDACLIATNGAGSALGAALDVQSVDSAGFTTIVDLAGGATALVHYLAFGSTPALDRTATLAVTEAADTAAGAATLALQATLAVTDAVDTMTSAAKVALAASLATTEAADTVASSATLALRATLTVTEGNDAAASTATLRLTGTLAATDAADTLSSAALLSRLGALSLSEDGDVANGADVLTRTTRNLVWQFGPAPVVTCPGVVHGLASLALRVEVWSTATPGTAVRLFPAITIHPTTYDITLAMVERVPGTLIINGARMSDGPRGNAGTSFTNQTSVTIAGATHGYATDALLVDVYDTAGTLLPYTPVTIDRTTFDVTVNFVSPQSGYVVLCMAAATGATLNTNLNFTSQTTVTLPEATYPYGTRNKGVQVWDAGTPAQQIVPASVTVHPSTFDVTVTFLTPQSGRVVLNGSQGTVGLQGTLSATDEADSASSTATLALQGTVALTEADDAAASTATVAVTGVLTSTDAADTLVSAATLRLQAILALLDADDTAASTGVLPLRATLTAPDADDTLLSLGITLTGGSLVVTDADDSVTSTALLSRLASLAVAEASDGLASTSVLALQAALTVTDAGDGLASTGSVTTRATLAVTDADDVVASTSTLVVQATLAVLETEDAISSLAALVLQGTLAVIEAEDGLASSALLERIATLAVTEANDTLLSLQMELPPTPAWIIVIPAPTLTQSTGQLGGLVQSQGQPVGLFEAKGLTDTLAG